MTCPSCGRELQQMQIGEITVDVCEGGCGGIWFDRFELRKVDERHESAGDLLLNIGRSDEIQVDHSQRRHCPKCENIVMMRHFFSPKKEVEVDECPKCGGVWLDAGELLVLRNQFRTEEERRQAVDDYFEEVFGRELAELRNKNDAGLGALRRFAHLFRFICPSYYVPGKQEWGAF